METPHPERDPIFHQMVLGRGEISDGCYTLPSRAGRGVEFDPDLIKRHRAN